MGNVVLMSEMASRWHRLRVLQSGASTASGRLGADQGSVLYREPTQTGSCSSLTDPAGLRPRLSEQGMGSSKPFTKLFRAMAECQVMSFVILSFSQGRAHPAPGFDQKPFFHCRQSFFGATLIGYKLRSLLIRRQTFIRPRHFQLFALGEHLSGMLLRYFSVQIFSGRSSIKRSPRLALADSPGSRRITPQSS